MQGPKSTYALDSGVKAGRMEGYESVYDAIKKERFYSELMVLRERLLK